MTKLQKLKVRVLLQEHLDEGDSSFIKYLNESSQPLTKNQIKYLNQIWNLYWGEDD